MYHPLPDTAIAKVNALSLNFGALSGEAIQNSLVDCNPVKILGSILWLSPRLESDEPTLNPL